MQFAETSIQFGWLQISYFGFIILAAVTTGALASWNVLRRNGVEPDKLLDVLFWAFASGLAGGRLLFVIFPPPSTAIYLNRDWYFAHPFDLLIGPVAIWSGGIETAGVLPGALVGAWIALRREASGLWTWADLLTTGALAALSIAPLSQLASTTADRAICVYAAGWALALMIAGILIRRNHSIVMPTGTFFLTSLNSYVVGLFAIDFLRIDADRSLFGLTALQIACGVTAALAAVASIPKLGPVFIGKNGNS